MRHSVCPKTKSEILNDLSILFKEQSVPSFLKNIEAICMDHSEFEMDAKIKNPIGNIRDIHFMYLVVNEYSLDRIIISTEDITERKADENVIFFSQKKIESLISTVYGIVWKCDIKTFYFSFISGKVEKILEYTTEECLASETFWIDHIYPQDQEDTNNYCTLHTNQNLKYDSEYRFVTKNRTIVRLRNIVSIVFDNDKAIGLRGIMIDFTKNKEA